MTAPEPPAAHDSPHRSSNAQPSPFRSLYDMPKVGVTSICRTLSLLGSRIANTLSSAPEYGQGSSSAATRSSTAYNWAGLGHEQGTTFADDERTLNGEQERSVSRGRDALISSGRGGAGNIRQASVSRDARPNSGPDDFSDNRGREPRQEQTHVFSTGRGGAGNIRSPSRDVGVVRSGADDKDQGVIKSHIIADQEAGVHSTGRGGIGNIRGGSGSRSRSRARDAPIHSTGRGGVGNLLSGDVPREDEREMLAAKAHHNQVHGDEKHSTGRGGAANISKLHSPPVEHPHHKHHHGDYESTGRGGVGNIIRE